MERVGAQDCLRGAGSGRPGDPVRAVGGHVGQQPAALFAEGVEEGVHGPGLAAGRGPDQHPGVVVHHDDQVLVATLVGDLVDPDAPQPSEPVAGRLRLGSHPGDDGACRAPGNPHQGCDRGLRARRGQPGDLVIEEPGVRRAVPGPRHRHSDHPMLRARHPRRVRLQIGAHGAQVQGPPPAPALPIVITRAFPPAATAPVRQPLMRAHPHDEPQRRPAAIPAVLLVPADVLDDGVFAAEQLCP